MSNLKAIGVHRGECRRKAEGQDGCEAALTARGAVYLFD